MVVKASGHVWWGGLVVVLCLLLNYGVAEDGRVADLLGELREANSVGGNKARAVFISHVLGISKHGRDRKQTQLG